MVVRVAVADVRESAADGTVALEKSTDVNKRHTDEYAKLNKSQAEMAAALTEIGRTGHVGPALATLGLGLIPLLELATPDQQDRYLAGVAGGARLSAALHEPGTALPTTPSVTLADGRLAGTKIGVPYADGADWLLVSTDAGVAVASPSIVTASAIKVTDPIASTTPKLAASSGSTRPVGIGRPRVEPSFLPGVIDRMMCVPDSASIAAAHHISRVLGRRVGPSTGTNVWGAFALLAEMVAAGIGGSVVTLICDAGDRYADTYYNEDWLRAQGLDPSHHADALVGFERSCGWPLSTSSGES